MREGARGQPKRSLEDSASVRDQHCNEGQRLGRKSEVVTFVNSQVAGAVGVSLAAGCSLTGNRDCNRSDVPEREHASSSPKGRVAGADCGSVLLITAMKSQSGAWRKSKRVLRLSVDRSHPSMPGMKAAIDKTASPKPKSRFAWNRKFRDEAVRQVQA